MIGALTKVPVEEDQHYLCRVRGLPGKFGGCVLGSVREGGAVL